MSETPTTRFEISAPGKVILHGEHSVVYGKPAVAGPIDLRTYFYFRESEEKSFHFNYEKLEFKWSISLEQVNLLLAEVNCADDLEPLMFLYKLRESRDFMFKYISVEEGADHMFSKVELAVGVTLFLLNRIFRGEGIKEVKRGCRVHINSDMSIGAGLGSSASVGVCIAAGLFIIAQLHSGKMTPAALENFDLSQNKPLLDKICKWAFDSEVIMHEKPSGIDNTIATYGDLIKFCRGEEVKLVHLKVPLDIMIVDTAISRNTSRLVASVATLQETFPTTINSIIDAMGNLVEDVVRVYEKEEEGYYEKLETLFSVNNNLLRAIGVSHPSLEKIFIIAELHGFKAKLTGAGGGGCALILLPPDYLQLNNYTNLCDDLTQNKLVWMKTTICGTGVQFKLVKGE